MKKSLLLLPLFLLTACQPKTNTPAQAPADQTQAETINETEEMGKLAAQGKPLACVITDKKTQTSFSYKMADKKVRISGMTQPGKTEKTSMLFDEQFMYVWDEDKKTGTKLVIPDPNEVNETLQQQGQNLPDLSTEESRQQYIDQGYTLNCEEARVQDSDFVPPTDVTFTDLSTMMDASNQMMQNPTATLSPAQQQMIQQKSEQMMKQYTGQ